LTSSLYTKDLEVAKHKQREERSAKGGTKEEDTAEGNVGIRRSLKDFECV
jgi:hypothetical protein